MIRTKGEMDRNVWESQSTPRLVIMIYNIYIGATRWADSQVRGGSALLSQLHDVARMGQRIRLTPPWGGEAHGQTESHDMERSQCLGGYSSGAAAAPPPRPEPELSPSLRRPEEMAVARPGPRAPASSAVCAARPSE